MPNAMLSAGPIVDRNVDKIQPYFGGSIGSTVDYNSTTGGMDSSMRKTDPSWYGSEVEQTMGSTPGHMVTIIPCNAGKRDEKAFTVVFNPDGVLADIQHGTAVCGRKRYIDAQGNPQEQLIHVGQVVDIEQVVDSGEQCLKITSLDARDKLKDVRIVGRFIYFFGHFY
jgi:hypothetical protein